MSWIRPAYSKKAVNKAGNTLRGSSPEDDFDKFLQAYLILDNWRSAHALPLNAVQMNLRNLAKKECQEPLIAQRLKRTPSILAKLNRYQNMQLSRMQDIGGCRAVLDRVHQVRAVHRRFLESRTLHHLVGERNYIDEPKESGYRGVHLVYRYESSRNRGHNGLMVEVQIRSKAQHIWATGVETLGTFINSPLKSSIGPDEWLRFFALLASAIACLEDSPTVPGTPESKEDIAKQLREINDSIGALEKLEHFGTIADYLGKRSKKNDRIFLLQLKPMEHKTLVNAYRASQLQRATQDYLAAEKSARPDRGEDIVLVTIDSITMLRNAYPNYFMDTKALVGLTKAFVGLGPPAHLELE